MAAEHNHLHDLDEAELAVAARVPGDAEGEVILEALAENGIKAIASGGATGSLGVGALGVVRILVQKEDVQRAKEIITAASHKGEQIDWSKVDVGEPIDE